MSITYEPGSVPATPPIALMSEDHAEAARFIALSRTSASSVALAGLQLTQMQALQHRIRNDLESLCSLASFHADRADGIASEAGFDAVGRRAMVLATLYEELLRCEGVETVNLASYLMTLCARLATVGKPIGTRLVLHVEGHAEWSAALVMSGCTASALGTVAAELVAAVGGGATLGRGCHVLVQLMPPKEDGQLRHRRGCLTVSATIVPDGANEQQPSKRYDLALARSLVAQVGGELDRFVSVTGAGWCVRF